MLNPLIRVSSPLILFSIILLFSKPYDFAEDPSLSPLTPLDTTQNETNILAENETNTITQNETDTINENAPEQMKIVISRIKDAIKRNKDVIPIVLTGIVFVIGALGVAWLIKGRKGAPVVNPFTGGSIGPSLPEGETTEQSYQKLKNLIIDIHNVGRLKPETNEQALEEFDKEIKAWEANTLERASMLARQGKSEEELPDPKKDEKFAKRFEFIEKNITPYLKSANPTILTLASLRIKTIGMIAARTYPIFADLPVEVSQIQGGSQKGFNYEKYAQVVLEIRQKTETLSNIEEAIIKIFELMIPRMIRINNHIQPDLEKISQATWMLQRPELPKK